MDKEIDGYLGYAKSILIAPAGYGKTTFLSQCINKILPTITKRILVLTHTHAGVASIKSKCCKNVNNGLVEITTISGFFQKIFCSFYGNLPTNQENGKPNFKRINEDTHKISQNKILCEILGNTYCHVFVDEYQDCSIKQHETIINLSRYIKLHVLADPLQAIFKFNKSDGVLDFATDFADFVKYDFLQTPWRWYKISNNRELGDSIKCLRLTLQNSGTVQLDKMTGVKFIKTSSNDNCFYRILINTIANLNSSSLLILYPNGYEYSIEYRAKNRSRFDFTKEFTIIEAIDDKSFYTAAILIDNFINTSDTDQFFPLLLEIFINCSFNKSDLNLWFNNKSVKNKKDITDNKKAQKLKLLIKNLLYSRTSYNLHKILSFLRYELHLYPKRTELYASINNILKISSTDSTLERMTNNRNKVRILGRKVEGKNIGTTLLTKGLEFDDVIVIDAHKIIDRENFYVAMTRASKRLIIMSNNTIWNNKGS